jgi:CdiI immunity protein
MKKKQHDEAFQFLAGNFHQDIESPEDALEELLRESNKYYLNDAVLFLKKFINSAPTKHEKNNFIEESADGVYFPALEQEPIDWLQDIILKIETKLK